MRKKEIVVRVHLVLLKVVLVVVVSESGFALSTYGLLDTAAARSMINYRIAAKMKVQGVPHDCELSSQVKFHNTSTSEEGLSTMLLTLKIRTCPIAIALVK